MSPQLGLAHMLLALCVIFVLSGAAGLVYESIWTRYLGLFVGHSAYAQVLVLVIFLGGMSIGALGIGRRAERVRNPLLWYALVEFAVGAIGLVFHDVFVFATHLAYDSLFPALGPGATHSIAKWSLAALLILPQSVLLGATFPLMTAGALRLLPDRAGRTISLLYFANSLGAAVGVVFAGFALIRWVGLPGTLLTAAMVNIVVGGAAYLVAQRVAPAQKADSALTGRVANTTAAPSPSLSRLMLAVSFGTAISSFVYEIGWIRMLSLVLGSATHSFELMLSAFILGLAIGALIVRRRTSGDDDALHRLALVQLAMGALAVATLPVYALSFDGMADFMVAFTKTPAGYVGFSAARYAICLAVMLPATICAGMTLPLITRFLLRGEHGERALGQVYGVNTLGSIVGVVFAVLVLLPLLGLKWMIVAGASIDIALGFRLLAAEPGEQSTTRSAFRWAPAFAVAAFALIVGAMTRFDQGVLTSGVYRYGTAHSAVTPEITFFKDGRTATVSVRRIHASNGLSLATNGKPDGSLGPEWFVPATATRAPFTHDASTQVLMPLVALAHVPNARVVAVIGQGTGMSSHALLGDDGLERLVTIEIEPQMIRASRQFYPANRRVFDDSRAAFALDDARSYFAAQRERYDLILSVPSNPWVAGVSGLFTTEFYAHVRRFLAPHGIFAQWIHLSETNDGLLLSVIRALAENFPDYTLYAVANKDILIVATNDTKVPAPDWSVLRRPAIAADLARVLPITPAMLDALRIVGGATLAPLTRGSGGANSDFYPTLDLGAERSRYLQEGAMGFVGLSGDRFGLATLLEAKRFGAPDATYSVLFGVPRLEAMALGARVLRGDFTGATGPQLGAAERARIVELMLASIAPPVNWHVWVEAVRETEETRAGGRVGVADTAFYDAVSRYVARQSPPAEVRAAVAFLHGLASLDYDEVVTAAKPLVDAALRGDLWLPGDVLRDGAVIALLRTGDVRDARFVLDALRNASSRTANDVRGQLLTGAVRDAEHPRTVSRRIPR